MAIRLVTKATRVGAPTLGVGAALWIIAAMLPTTDVRALEIGGATPPQCVAPSEYYRMELVPTRSIPGASRSRGQVGLTFRTSPFGVDLGTDGSYQYHLEVEAPRLPPARGGEFVAWVSTPQLDDVQRLGVLSEGTVVTGTVAWNKFLVFVTLEAPDADAATWQGPVILRGISRSGLMHTMAGHGAFEEENCATYGY